ncbi:hypothetical protein DVH05_024755 [Phytophthora capsici]|nr:hypothetical protein DVH05_024755 [Phytophthora capsici]
MFTLPTFVMFLVVPILVMKAEDCSTEVFEGISHSLPNARALRQERVVDSSDVDSKAQRISGHVATVLGHSAPMDEVGQVVGMLLGV